MEILFLWIKKFRHFNETSINLSSEFFIDIEYLENGSKMSLVIKRNPSFIENFFEKNNVENVSVLIGKNGAGKSAILHYIINHLPEGLAANFLNDIIIYSFFQNGKKQYHINYPSFLNIQINDSTKLFSNQPYSEFPESTDTFRFASKFSDATFIFYSYFIELSPSIDDYHGLKNISTVSLINDERKFREQEIFLTDKDSSYKNLTNSIDLLSSGEISRALQLLTSEYRKIIEFEIPPELTIFVNQSDKYDFIRPSTNFPKVSEILRILKDRNNEDNFNERSINNLSISVFSNFLRTQLVYSSGYIFEYKFSILKKESPKQYVIRFFKELKNSFYEFEGKKVEINRHKEMFDLFIQFINFFEHNIKIGALRVENEVGSEVFKLQTVVESNETFQQLINIYLKIKGITGFLEFTWRNLSTGEQSFLSFMSRFYHLKRHQIGNDDLKRNIVILIDEGDAGYHPEWQRKFLKSSLDFLSSLFTEHQLQLIYTANTPFLTSDLPKSNVIFIKKDENNVSIEVKENNRAQTFGSNIHTLYSDSFYMDGALVGEFAKFKIDRIIDYLNNKENKEPDPRIKKTIDIIGEPLIRNKLNSMWSNKFGFFEELKTLENRIQEIKRQQNND